MPQRYDMRREDDGLWSVIDLATEEPADLPDMRLIHLEMDEADDAVERLNALARRNSFANENKASAPAPRS